MGKYAVGKDAYGISDRSGFRYRLRDMRKEWNGLLVGKDEYEEKHPQIQPVRRAIDAEALRDSGILQRTFKNPVILQRLNDIIKDKIEGKQGTATTAKGKGTFEVKSQEKS